MEIGKRRTCIKTILSVYLTLTSQDEVREHITLENIRHITAQKLQATQAKLQYSIQEVRAEE